jgi:hypothetical protein
MMYMPPRDPPQGESGRNRSVTPPHASPTVTDQAQMKSRKPGPRGLPPDFAIAINAAFALPYAWFWYCGLAGGGRGSGAFGLFILLSALMQFCVGVVPALLGACRRSLQGAVRAAVLLTAIGSLLSGVVLAILAIANESGC